MSSLDVPTSANQLVSDLLKSGFWAVRDFSGPMGEREIVLRGTTPPRAAGIEIKVSGDRGHWVITFRIEPLSRHLTPEAWAAYLDGTTVRAPDVDREVSFIRNRLSDAVTAVRDEPNAESQVWEIGRGYMRRLLDAPPPDDKRFQH